MLSLSTRLFGLLVGLGYGVASAQASPISYAFSGTLAQPYNGSTQFSGTLTYNTDLPPYPGIQPSPGWSYYSGVPNDPTSPVVSLTFNLGGTSSSSFGSLASDEVIVAHTQSADAFFIEEAFNYSGGQNLHAEFGIGNNNLVYRGPLHSLNPPSSLNLADFSDGANLTFWGKTASGQDVNVVGTVTSLVPLTVVPEPASLLVFGVMGAGYFGSRRARAGRGNP